MSVTLLYCGQTVGRIKMKLDMQVWPRRWPHCVRWGPSSPSPKGRAPIFSPYLVKPNIAGWINMPLCTEVGLEPSNIVLDGDPAPSPQKGTEPPLIFGPCLLWPNGWMDQDATWYGGRPPPRWLCVRWLPSSPPRRGTTTSFRPMSIVVKRLDEWRCQLVRK